jgi:hypothetical protein
MYDAEHTRRSINIEIAAIMAMCTPFKEGVETADWSTGISEGDDIVMLMLMLMVLRSDKYCDKLADICF